MVSYGKLPQRKVRRRVCREKEIRMLEIITDSSAELSAEEARALGVRVVPLTVIFGGDAYLEGEELSKEEFYKRLPQGPRTSQPSAEQFAALFAQTEGRETLVLPIASALSGTQNAARLAKEQGGFSNVTIYESNCTTAMLRILVEEAVRHRDKSAAEVVALLDKLRPRIRLAACLDTLEYLERGGRIKKSTAFVGTLFGIKPIVGIFPDGTVGMTGRAHGQKKALQTIAARFLEETADPAYPVYFLQTDSPVPALTLQQLTGQEGAPVLRICCAVGSHIGPNAAGIVYVVRED